MHATRNTISITTDADGNGIGYIPVETGRVATIIYVKNTYVDGVDVTVTAEATSESIWSGTNVNASARVAPRLAIHDPTGSVIADQYEPILIAQDRVKIAIASGGDTKSGTFHVIIG